MKYILFALIALLSATSVAAQPSVFDSLADILGTSDLGAFYEEFGLWIDLIVYIFLFVYVAKFAFHSQQGMNKIGVVIGVALAIAAVVWESSSEFRLANIGPYGIAVLMLILGWWVYKAIHGMGDGSLTTVAIAFVVAYGLFLSYAGEIQDELAGENAILAFIFSLANVVFIGFIIYLIFHYGKKFAQGGAGGLRGTRRRERDDIRRIIDTREEEKDDIEDIKEEEKEEEEVKEEEKELDEVEKLLADEDAIANNFKDFLEKLQQFHDPNALKQIGAQRGDQIRNAALQLANYTEKANQRIERIRQQKFAKQIAPLQKMLKERAVDEAKEIRDSRLPLGNAPAKTDKRRRAIFLRGRNRMKKVAQRGINRRIEQDMESLRQAALQDERALQQLEGNLEQVSNIENSIKSHADELVTNLNQGNVQGTTNTINTLLGETSSAETALRSVGQYAGQVKRHIEQEVRQYVELKTKEKDDMVQKRFEEKASVKDYNAARQQEKQQRKEQAEQGKLPGM